MLSSFGMELSTIVMEPSKIVLELSKIVEELSTIVEGPSMIVEELSKLINQNKMKQINFVFFSFANSLFCKSDHYDKLIVYSKFLLMSIL